MKKLTIKHYAFSLALSLLAMGSVSATPWSLSLWRNLPNARVAARDQEYLTQIINIGNATAAAIKEIGKNPKDETAIQSLATTLKGYANADEKYNITNSQEFNDAGSKSIMAVVEALKTLPENLCNAQALATTLTEDFLTIYTETPTTDVPAVAEFLEQVELLRKKTLVVEQKIQKQIEQTIQQEAAITLEAAPITLEKEQTIQQEETQIEELSSNVSVIHTPKIEDAPEKLQLIAPEEGLQKMQQNLQDINNALTITTLIEKAETEIAKINWDKLVAKQKIALANKIYKETANQLETLHKGQEKEVCDSINKLAYAGKDAPMIKFRTKLDELVKTTAIIVEPANEKAIAVKIEKKAKNQLTDEQIKNIDSFLCDISTSISAFELEKLIVSLIASLTE